ncbi:uncharacterized protein [Ptychodera flava]|uniref:uncharacterized protein n=1 Tax=Ptychodera flava TaxID=63121 RepID=UPI00396A13C1
MLRRESDWQPNKFSRVCCRHFEGSRGPTNDHPVPTLFEYNNWGKPASQRPTLKCRKRLEFNDVENKPALQKVPDDKTYEVYTSESVLESELYDGVSGEVEITEKSSQVDFHEYSAKISTPVPKDHQYVATQEDMDVDCEDLVNASVQTNLTIQDPDICKLETDNQILIQNLMIKML